MISLNKHIKEYYQGNKFLGSTTHEGEVPANRVGYYGMTKMTEGEVRLKKVYKASAQRPIEVVCYNMQGR